MAYLIITDYIFSSLCNAMFTIRAKILLHKKIERAVVHIKIVSIFYLVAQMEQIQLIKLLSQNQLYTAIYKYIPQMYTNTSELNNECTKCYYVRNM